MKLTPYLILLIYLSIVHTSIYDQVKDNVLSFIQRSISKPKKENKDLLFFNDNSNVENALKYFEEKPNGDDNDLKQLEKTAKDYIDIKRGQEKARIMKRVRENIQDPNEPFMYQLADQNKVGQRYRMDPVLNFLSRRISQPIKKENFPSSSSSLELPDWKDEWREHWIQKKFEAINTTQAVGDTVNMLAARPWGVPCGDPNQHDMPWGTCMLPMECESEYRIYRGDSFCGRTQFICCALQLTNYDMYQGFDVSFADTSMQTDSAEMKHDNTNSKEKHRKKKARQKRFRKRQRLKRKRKIKKNIKRIIKEIRKILTKSYRNGTTARKKKTKQLKKFIGELKKQYQKDRKNVKGIHEVELIKIDTELQKKIDQIRGLNQNFIHNETFREIIVNGTVSPKVVRMLLETYPDLARMLDSRRTNSKPDYLEYDIEYGMLYY